MCMSLKWPGMGHGTIARQPWRGECQMAGGQRMYDGKTQGKVARQCVRYPDRQSCQVKVLDGQGRGDVAREEYMVDKEWASWTEKIG
jgi:hypothetical protein